MARPLVLPDPNDRSKNSPFVDVDNNRVLGIYNQNTGEGAQRVTDKVRDWFTQYVQSAGWDLAEFSGTHCRLTNTRVRDM